MKKKALITGITGQDGSYLSELLLKNDYDVYGMVRRSSTEEINSKNIHHIINDIELFYGDVTDTSSLERILTIVKPDEVYNLAAQSHVKISFDNPVYTANVTGLGTLNLLESIRNSHPPTKMFQACTSEMFGNSIDDDGFQRESTPMKPANPYACAKLYAYNICRNYRNSYNMFICNGILFNHESPRRGDNFVTQKVVTEAVRISRGLSKELKLGNLSAKRDWGHAKDYVKAMHLIMQNNKSDDYVCATGVSRSVEDLCEYVFSRLKLNYKDYVKSDTLHIRPEETIELRGDASKLTKTVNWKPEYTFESMINEMIDWRLRETYTDTR